MTLSKAGLRACQLVAGQVVMIVMRRSPERSVAR